MKQIRKFLRQNPFAPCILGAVVAALLFVFAEEFWNLLFRQIINESPAGLLTIGGFAITAWSIVVGTQGSIGAALKEVNPAVWADMMKVFSDVSKTAFVLFVGILIVRLVDSSAGLSALHQIGVLKLLAKGGLIAGSVALGIQIWKVIWILERLVRPLPPSGNKT